MKRLPLTEEKYTRVWFLNVVITGIPDMERAGTRERVIIPNPAVLLKDSGKRVISIIVKKDEARTIKDVIEKNPDRPKIYELLVNILKKAHVEIKGTFVYNVRNWRYLTRLRFKIPGEKKVSELACRPSDALLVSILNDSPIYISNELMEEISIDTSEIPRQR